MRWMIMLALWGFSPSALGQRYEKSQFQTTPPPKLGSKQWRRLNHSDREFAVRSENGKLLIEKAVHEDRTELTLDDGRLIGVDRGEWGGRLVFIPHRNDGKVIHIKNGNIKSILKFKDKLYFFEGLAHLTQNGGALYQLTRLGEKYTYKEVVGFDDAPRAVAVGVDKIYVATHSGFCVVDAKMNKKALFKDMFWRGLYPNSVCILGTKAHIGIRSGYLEIDLSNKELNFCKYRHDQ